jgi:hypothetical protein
MCNATLPFYLFILPVLIDSNNLQILGEMTSNASEEVTRHPSTFSSLSLFPSRTNPVTSIEEKMED